MGWAGRLRVGEGVGREWVHGGGPTGLAKLLVTKQ